MFIVLYRWRVKTEKESQFIEAWSEITAFLRENYGSWGSRLYRGDDGIFYAYAQWRSSAQRDEAFQNAPKSEAGKRMKDAIEEGFPEARLEMVSDYLLTPNEK